MSFIQWLSGVCIIFLIFKIFEMIRMFQRQKRQHDFKVKISELEHRVELMHKDLDIDKERMKTIELSVRCLNESIKFQRAHQLLLSFKIWWKTEGQHEFEVVRKTRKREDESPSKNLLLQ